MADATEFKEIASGVVREVEPFDKTTVELSLNPNRPLSGQKEIKVTLYPDKPEPVVFQSKVEFGQ